MRYSSFLTVLTLLLLSLIPGASAVQQGEYQQLSHRVVQLYREGNYTEGISVAEQAVAAAEKTFGSKHQNVALMVSYLGIFQRDAGHLSEAEPLFKRALDLYQELNGPDDINVGIVLGNLAILYKSEDKTADAESLFKRSLAIAEKKWGSDSLEITGQLRNLARFYLDVGQYDNAEVLYKRWLSINETKLGANNPAVAESLVRLAELYKSAKKFSEAELMYNRALSIQKSIKTDSRTLATTLCNFAMLYANEGANGKGAPFFSGAIGLWQTYLSEKFPEFAASLSALEPLYINRGHYQQIARELEIAIAAVEKLAHTTSPADQVVAHARLAGLLENESKYEEAERLYRRALAITSQVVSANDPNVAVASANLAQLLRKEGKYSEAETLDLQALMVLKKEDQKGPYVGMVLMNLGIVVQHQRRYREAENLFKQSVEILEKTPDNLDFPIVLFNLGKLCFEEDRYGEAESLYKRSLQVLLTRGFDKSAGYGEVQVELAAVYVGEGKYSEAERLALTALHEIEEAKGPDAPSVAYLSLVLAEVYTHQAKLSEADQFERRALEISKSSLGAHDPELAIALEKMARFYDLEGNFIAAEPLAQEALQISENIFGQNDPSVIHALNDLAILYREHKKFREAEALCQQALRNAEAALPPEPLLIADSLTALAGVYKDQARFAEAEPLYQRAVTVSEGASVNPANLAALINNLAVLYDAEGRFSQAEPLLKRALGIMENTADRNNPDLGMITSTLANLYYQKGHPEDAKALFLQSLRNLSNQFRGHFSYMSEKQRLLFLQLVFDRFPIFFSFCTTNHEKYPQLVGDMYDVVLWEKGIVARSIASQRAALAEDASSTVLINQLKAKESQFASLRASSSTDHAQWERAITQLENEMENIQRELARQSNRTAQQKSLDAVGWRDVQKALAKDEAAVEFVRFSFATKTAERGKAIYVALIVTPEMSVAPSLVPLGPATVLEGPPIAQYRIAAKLDTGIPINGPTFYDCVWKPLEPILAGKKRIFVSTDGVLNQVSFAVVSDNQRLLIEKYDDIIIVSSTSDLLRERDHSSKRFAVLIGNPKFDLDEAEYKAAVAALQHYGDHSEVASGATPGQLIQSGSMHFRTQDQQGASLESLGGTKDELKSLLDLLEKDGWKVNIYSEEKALKEALVAINGPRILHVATHGFFLDGQKRRQTDTVRVDFSKLEDPMLRSGLYLAGANRSLKGGPPVADLGNGVLTAYEASGLNLRGTELVVLSACGTGLGELRDGEGVFGLHRALQEAGAEAVLMSMWPVPDIETKELMTSFYEKWLAGLDKQHALKEAQLDEKTKVKDRWGKDRPDLWGAFVLVGR